MHKTRLEAFSDGVLAIIITIMVLELKVPHGEELTALRPLVPAFLELRSQLRVLRDLLGTTIITCSRPPGMSTGRSFGPTCICSFGCRSFLS